MSLKKRLQEKSAGIGSLPPEGRDTPPVPSLANDRVARTAPGQLLAFRGMLQESEAEIAKLKDELSKPGVKEIALSDLHELPGRRRKLTDEEFLALKDNLSMNALITPITVRFRREGGFEIVSGHNRVAALRELGRESVAAAVVELGDEQADLGAFYANLFHPALPDFAKYLGVKRRMDQKSFSQAQVAREAGLDDSTVSRWMTYEGLPSRALEIIARRPEKVGSKSAAELSKLLPSLGEEAVVAIVEKMVAGDSQAKAIRDAKSGFTHSAALQDQQEVVIKRGRYTFCTIKPKGQLLVLRFSNAADRESLNGAIEALIAEHAAAVQD